MTKTPILRHFSIFAILSFFMIACSGGAKVTQGNDASASVFQPNNLTTASAQISAASGGYINVGSAQLRIPAQALDSDTTITAEIADISLPAGSAQAVGKGIRLKPEGLQFLNPAELEICYSGSEAAALNESNAQIYYHTEDNQYVAIAGTVDVNRHCVKSHIEHFSSYVAAAVAQVPGNTAPVIGGANFLPATPMAGIPLRVRTAITDVNGGAVPGQVVSAFLYYRTVGAPSFTKVALQPDDTDDTVTNRYYYQIPASAVTLAGIEYYFEATDNLNLLRRLPAAAGTFSTRTVPTSATALRFNPVGDLQISAGFMRALTLQAFDGTAWQNISVDNSALTNPALGSLLRTGPSTVRFSAVGAGAGQITSTIASLTTATNINVVPGLLTHIEITDVNQVILTGTANLPAGQVYNFDVIGFDTYGNVATILPLITTTGSIGTISTDLTGAHLAAAASAGSGSIVADIAGFTDTLNVNIYMPPQVTATAPFDNTSGIAITTNIGVSFSHVMNTSTLTATTTTVCTGSIQVSADDFATCVPMASATPSFFASNTLAILSPAANLAGGTTYKIRVTVAALDTDGYPLAATYTTPVGFSTLLAPSWHVNDLTSNMIYHNMCEDTSTGKLYIAGSYDDAVNSHWFVKTSSATGAAWTYPVGAVDIVQPKTDVYPKIACDSAGNIYMMAPVSKHWGVMKSTDQGATFVSVDSVPATYGRSTDIAINGANEVYVIGVRQSGDLAVRKSDSTGTVWSEVVLYNLPGYTATEPRGTLDGSGNLYFGSVFVEQPSGSISRLIVQKYDGAALTVLDDYANPAGEYLRSNRLPMHIFGSKLYVGDASKNTTTNMSTWFIRQCDLSTCAAGNWTNIDPSYVFEGGGSDYDISDFYQDQFNGFWSNGLSFHLAGPIYFIARYKAAAAASWSDAIADFGDHRFGTYLRTSTNRFFFTGLEFNAGVFKGVVTEYR